MAPSCATRASLRAPPLRLPADQSRSAPWETASAPPTARRSAPWRPTPTTGGRSPDSGVDMVTQSGKQRLSSAVTAGLAFAAGALVALAAQQRRYEELRLRVAEVERSDRQAMLTEQQRLQFYLLSRAMEDPDLAAVYSNVQVDSPTQRRQYLFANALYTNALLAYRVGVVNWEELHGHLRMICLNPIFRNYWEAHRPHRASLEDNSEEARVGRMVDILIRDLDEADTEEWWVVGEPPLE
ncbi:DUF6082 family protein [Streptomyces sp. NPDC050597]|uniref:DUF6082 family protein n=2 Tax=Streptomyces TaxID=1883 RepID=UPI003442085D